MHPVSSCCLELQTLVETDLSAIQLSVTLVCHHALLEDSYVLGLLPIAPPLLLPPFSSNNLGCQKVVHLIPRLKLDWSKKPSL